MKTGQEVRYQDYYEGTITVTLKDKFDHKGEAAWTYSKAGSTDASDWAFENEFKA